MTVKSCEQKHTIVASFKQEISQVKLLLPFSLWDSNCTIHVCFFLCKFISATMLRILKSCCFSGFFFYLYAESSILLSISPKVMEIIVFWNVSICLTDKPSEAMSNKVLWSKHAGIRMIALMKHIHKWAYMSRKQWRDFTLKNSSYLYWHIYLIQIYLKIQRKCKNSSLSWF